MSHKLQLDCKNTIEVFSNGLESVWWLWHKAKHNKRYDNQYRQLNVMCRQQNIRVYSHMGQSKPWSGPLSLIKILCYQKNGPKYLRRNINIFISKLKIGYWFNYLESTLKLSSNLSKCLYRYF